MFETATDDAATASTTGEVMARRRAEIGGGLRMRVAQGTIVNSIYLLAINALTIVQGLVLAALLGSSEYGLWGLLGISFGTLFALGAIGFDDKYIQQDQPDQEAAFQVAFTLQSALAGVFTLLALVAVPLFSLLYEQPQILAPGLLLALIFPLLALQTPTWVFYRRMDFVKQRVLQGATPVVTFVVTVTLALTGLGFWSVVLGTLAGALAGTILAVAYSPYRLRLRYERGAFREYATFSWPLFLGSISAVLMFQIPMTVAARSLGVAAIGAITVASQITQYTRRVDDIVTHALYPAICAVKDRRDVLFETFSKSNRLAVLWGFPTGVAAALFASAAVPLILGGDWKLAVPLVQVLGLSAAVDQIGFNWTAFARARGETRILGVASLAMLLAVVSVGVPLLLAMGLSGLAIGIGAGTLATLTIRMIYLTRLFPAARMASHVFRAIGPTIPAAAAILLERAMLGANHSAGRLAIEATVYVVLVAGGTWLTARPLLREALGYVTGRRGTTADAPA